MCTLLTADGENDDTGRVIFAAKRRCLIVLTASLVNTEGHVVPSQIGRKNAKDALGQDVM
jgi:hypothetical protein